MQIKELFNKAIQWRPPHLGQRIVKTTVAVFLCLLIYYLRGYHGRTMPTEAAITAIICLQPYVKDTRDYAISRFAGSLIGGAVGLLFLLLLYRYPVLGWNMFVLNAVMALGVLVSLYCAVLFKMPDASSLAAIVFLCVVITFPDIEQPLEQAFLRMVDVSIGTTIAILVNVFRLPREKNRNTVFFLRTKDLVPDKFTQLNTTALFKLNYLAEDGARICLISEHAPAFLTVRMSQAKVNIPTIVMDGAAIYDSNLNEYLYTHPMSTDDSSALMQELTDRGISFFIYTVHNDKTCIFHRGDTDHEERQVLNTMRSSPYRSYLEGEILDPAEIVYIKIISTDERITELEHELESLLSRINIRMVIRPQYRTEGISGLYIYAKDAYVESTEKVLMKMLQEKEPHLTFTEVLLKGGYHSERDAIHLLNTVTNYYEPVRNPFKETPPEIHGAP